MSNYLTNIAQRKAIDRLQQPRQYTATPLITELSLSRGTVVFVANVAQVITWQTEVRNSSNTTYQIPITWSGTTVTLPQDGYYAITLITSYSVTTAQMGVALAVNGVASVTSIADNSTGTQIHSVSFTQYFNANDYFELSVLFTTAGTMETNQERNVRESPFLYVSRIG